MAQSSSTGILDAAPGPLHPAARAVLEEAIDAGWADPARLYREGRAASHLREQARESLAADLGVPPATLTFHSDGTSALLSAIAGLRYARRRVGSAIVTSAVERQALLRAVGAEGRPLPVDHAGRVDSRDVERSLESGDVALVALQDANPEVGTRQPVTHAHSVCRARGIPLLVDAAASLGWAQPPVADALVADTSSCGGPPLGLLAVAATTRFLHPERPPVEQSRGWTAPWTPLVLAAAEASRRATAERAQEAATAAALVDRLRAAAAQVPDVEVVGDPHDRLPHVVTFSVLFADGEALVQEFAARGLAVASGSACASLTGEPSHVLAAMGVLTHGNLRLTLPCAAVSPGRESDVERFTTLLPDVVREVRNRLGTADL